MAIDSSRPRTPRELAEILGSLSLATEAAAGVPPETSIRAAVVSDAIAGEIGLHADERSAAYFTALLRYIGCTAFAWEAAWYGGGDDIALLADLSPIDAAKPLNALATVVTRAGRDRGLPSRARSVVRVLSDPQLPQRIATTHCAQAVTLTETLGLGPLVPAALADMYERADGRGEPAHKSGDGISIVARVVRTALAAVVHGAIEGPDAAVAAVKQRSGGDLDPDVARAFLRRAHDILPAVMAPSAWDVFIQAAPAAQTAAGSTDVPAIALAFARCVDLKSPWTHAHSTGVATLCRSAVERMGGSAEEIAHAYVAGLLHDLGRMSVPNGIWDKRGSLNAVEQQRMRSHVAATEAVLMRSPLLAQWASSASLHHERLDGSGYPRQASGKSWTRVDLALQAADVFHALTEDRPHRPKRTAEAAAQVIRDEVRASRLDARAADAVCAAGGARIAKLKGDLPSGLSEREVEVLALLARGFSNKEIGEALFISARTAGNHIAHIYEKTGIKTRAAAALFAVTRGLV